MLIEKLEQDRAQSSGQEINPAWPREVAMILSALEAGGAPNERREVRRTCYRVQAVLRLFADTHGSDDKLLYTRDVNPRSLGFVTSHRLPLGYGGTVDLPAPGGRRLTIHCTLLRCREAAPGWYEGALYFNREQTDFAAQASE
jgi:hypothetical protein